MITFFLGFLAGLAAIPVIVLLTVLIVNIKTDWRGKGFLVAALLLFSGAKAQPMLPNASLTPGATNGYPVEITSAHGYTPTVRNVPEKLKRQVFIEYFGKVPAKTSDYEVDHLISLELGGSNSISNLWPQSYLTFPYNAHVKDKLENYMARSVRAMLAERGHDSATTLLYGYQQEIATNWIVAYEKYLGTNSIKK
jgi:hypothetical protein